MKKSLSIIMALVLLIAFCLPLSVALATVESVDAEHCDICFNGTVYWVYHTYLINEACRHGKSGFDSLQYRQRDYTCDNCGHIFMSDPPVKIGEVCKGK